MSEYIGSRISLVSRSDIRYVGTLHEINSEASTVALENVSSFGTEGRKANASEEIAPSDSVYEYIVFRGTDVKDLRIEEPPAAKENKPPQVPNDPAILGSGSRPPQPQTQQTPPARQAQPQQQTHQAQQPPQSQPLQQAQQPQQTQQQHGPAGHPQFSQHSPYPQHFYPPPGQWGRGGPVPGPGYPGMGYGAPPGWYPPPGAAFAQGGPYPYGVFPPGPPAPPGPPGQQFQPQQKQGPISVGQNKQQAPGELSADKPVEPKTSSKATIQAAATGPSKVSTPPLGQKSVAKEATGPPTQPSLPKATGTAATKVTPTGPKNGRIVPAIPLKSPIPAKTTLESHSGNADKAPAAQQSSAGNRAAIDDATQAATAAVAAAMAKLPLVGGQQMNGSSAIDNLTKKVKEMRATDPVRAPRNPTGSGFAQRGRGRGGHSQENAKFEVPAADFDFQSSNAKFNKQDLVKEAIAGSPLAETPPDGIEDEANGNGNVVIPPSGSYNKASSFFDDLSSETKDRADGAERPGGRIWRGEEQKKNLETFGQGSVDNGYRGGYRGRGRGRGGHRGRGYGGNGQPGQPGTRGGRSGYRGGRNESQSVAQ